MWRFIKQRFAKKGECQRLRELLSPYLDQCLSSEEQGEVERHLASCQLCQEELASMRAAVDWLHQAPVVLPQRSFVIGEVRPVPRRPALAALRTATAVAAVALAVVFGGDLLHQFEVELPSQQKAGTETPGQDSSRINYFMSAAIGLQDVPGDGGVQEDAAFVGGNVSEQPEDGALPDGAGEAEVVEVEAGWVRPAEFSLLGVVVVLGGLVLGNWGRGRRRQKG